MLIGITDCGPPGFVNRLDIPFVNTASTSQDKIITNIRNIIRTLVLITVPDMSAIDLPFSFMLITRDPKS